MELLLTVEFFGLMLFVVLTGLLFNIYSFIAIQLKDDYTLSVYRLLQNEVFFCYWQDLQYIKDDLDICVLKKRVTNLEYNLTLLADKLDVMLEKVSSDLQRNKKSDIQTHTI